MFQPSHFKCVLLLAFIITSPLLHAENKSHDDELAIDSTLTLRRLVEKALPHYPNTQLLNAKKLELEARQIQAKSFLPSASSLVLRNQNDQLTSRRGESEWEFGVDIPIWLSGQRTAREAIAAASELNINNDKQSIQLQLAGMVRDALWDIHLMQGLAHIAKSKLESLTQLQNDVEKRVQLGDLAQKDLLVAQTEALQAEAESINAEAEFQHAKFRYMSLTGLKIIPQEFTEIKSAKNNLDEAHPALLEANGKIALSNELRNLAHIESRENPTLTVGARSLRGAFDNQYNDSIGLTLRIPLQSESRNAPLTALAEMHYAESQVHLSQLNILLTAAMHEAEHNLEVGSKQLDVLTKQNVIAQQNLNISRKAFQLGELDLSDLMRIQTQTFNTERTLKNQQVQQLWNIARYNQAVGELP
ncbi:MAG: TolC family protein [Bacteroidia bacterium]|nr:TolC family protein [Methylotenera sp.]